MYNKNENFTKRMKLNIQNHKQIGFVNIIIGKDTRLYLDPLLISVTDTDFARECNEAIENFFATLSRAYISSDNRKLDDMLAHIGEVNETYLGMSTAKPKGKGCSTHIMKDILKKAHEQGLFEKNILNKPYLFATFCNNFGEDRLSDMISNIIRHKLYEFTACQYKLYGIPFSHTEEYIGHYWDHHQESWKELVAKQVLVDNMNILLVPKTFVSKKYKYSIDSDLRHILIPYRQKKHLEAGADSSLCGQKFDKKGNVYYTKPTKQDILKSEYAPGEHKNKGTEQTIENPNHLEDFDELLIQKGDNLYMSDEEFDAMLMQGEVE